MFMVSEYVCRDKEYFDVVESMYGARILKNLNTNPLYGKTEICACELHEEVCK